MNQIKNIAIFFGGCSTEYEVSLQSAFSVIKSFPKDFYHPVLIGIDRHTGEWFLYQGDMDEIPKDNWRNQAECIPAAPSMDRRIHGISYQSETGRKTLSLDAALPILHGKNGEDGTIQGVLNLMDVPVIGCGLLSSAVCMDKYLAHQIVSSAGIKTAKCLLLKKDFSVSEVTAQAAELRYPLFVKPLRSGSSFGITKVQTESELLPAIKEAFLHDSAVMLEEAVSGFEVGCAVLGTKDLITGEIDEIELSDGFFNYTEKYTLKTSQIHVPARISSEQSKKIKETACKIYRLLGCSFFARVDLFLTPEGELYFNEVNTIPGFTSHSRYPNMLKAVGISFEEIIRRLLDEEFTNEKK